MDCGLAASSRWCSSPTSLSLKVGFRGAQRCHIPALNHQRRRNSLKVFAISSNDFKNGTEIEVDNIPWRIVEFLHVKPGKGSAFVRTKLKNCITGNTVDRTFRAGEEVQDARVEKSSKQFTYKDGDQFVFMDMVSFEELRLNQKEVGDKASWLREGLDCQLITWKERVIELNLPSTVKYKIVKTEPAVSGSLKPATLDTGAVINVPLFCEEGNEIFVDTRTGQYASRGDKFAK